MWLCQYLTLPTPVYALKKSLKPSVPAAQSHAQLRTGTEPAPGCPGWQPACLRFLSWKKRTYQPDRTPRYIASDSQANLFRRTSVSLCSTELHHIHLHLKTKRWLFEWHCMHWLRQLSKTPHHFGSSFSGFSRKLHQSTEPFCYYFCRKENTL